MVLLLSLLLLLSTSQAAVEWPQVALNPVVGGISQPVYVTSSGDGTGRLFVVERTGRIRIVQNGAITGTFLDITGRVRSTNQEQGLLSVAFPPGYASKGYFYVYYTASGTGAGSVLTISRFSITSADAADPSSENVIFTADHPNYGNHNGGLLMFGPDGYLYAGTGDGGSAGDPPNNAQNSSSRLGKLLRADVEHGATTPENYAIGLRNPWRYSWDRATGDLYIADVGQNLYEEVDFHPAAQGSGQNYGWRFKEGFHCYNPSTNCDQGGLTDPAIEYGHADNGCSITGGFVYRGPTYTRMWGTYFYGDYCSGKIWGLKRDSSGWTTQELADTTYNISSFGEDEDGRLYLTDITGGTVYEVTDPASPRTGSARLRLPFVRKHASA